MTTSKETPLEMGAVNILRHGNSTSRHRHTCAFALQATGIEQRRDNPLHGVVVSAVAVAPTVVTVLRSHSHPSLVDCGHATDARCCFGWRCLHHSHRPLAARYVCFSGAIGLRISRSRDRSRRVLPRYGYGQHAFWSF